MQIQMFVSKPFFFSLKGNRSCRIFAFLIFFFFRVCKSRKALFNVYLMVPINYFIGEKTSTDLLFKFFSPIINYQQKMKRDLKNSGLGLKAQGHFFKIF